MTVSKEKSVLKKIFRIPKLLLRSSIRITLKFGPVFIKKQVIYLFTDRLLRSRFNIILSYILAGEEEMHWRGIDVRADTRDMHGMLLYLFNSYSDSEIEKLIEVCREAKIFADVGANIGLISLSLAQACPNLEIFAFEPDHRILDKFRQNLDLNIGLSERIHLIEKAVTDIDGELFFQPSLDPKNMGLGKIIRQDKADPGSLRVPTVRFDNFFANIGRYPDVVKIDVEGEEGFVLEGMKNIPDSDLPKAIMLEVHTWYDPLNASAQKARIYNFFQEKKYVPYILEGDGKTMQRPPEEWSGHCHIIALLKDRAGNG